MYLPVDPSAPSARMISLTYKYYQEEKWNCPASDREVPTPSAGTLVSDPQIPIHSESPLAQLRNQFYQFYQFLPHLHDLTLVLEQKTTQILTSVF